jgi:hypothetical protein
MSLNLKTLTFWSGKLLTAPSEALMGLSLSPSLVQSLQDVGLPLENNLRVIQRLELKFTPDRLMSFQHNGENYLAFGHGTDLYSEEYLCLNKKTGEVYLIDLAHAGDDEFGVSFVNSSIEQFLNSVVIYDEYLPRLESLLSERFLLEGRGKPTVEQFKRIHAGRAEGSKLNSEILAALAEVDSESVYLTTSYQLFWVNHIGNELMY